MTQLSAQSQDGYDHERMPNSSIATEGTEEPETNPSAFQWEEQANATCGKNIADYKTDVNYKPQGSDQSIK